MHRILAALALLAACSPGATSPTATPAPAARYTERNELLPPVDYRSWTYLTSGLGMLYGPAAAAAAASGTQAMDNVYVSPGAYEAFLESGVWPDGALFVLEIRATESTGSIVNGGYFQTDLLNLEVHVKDTQRFADRGGWGFYGFATDGTGPTATPAVLIPASAACYTCHQEHGGVETTFTQFYPTAFRVARAKGTVRADFVGIPASQGDLAAAVAQGGWAAGEKLLDDTAARWPQAALLREGALNGAAYRLLAADRKPEAIAAFEYVTRRYPASTNAWDSLSEAYENAGRVDDARTAVARGLQALASDTALTDAARTALEQALRQRSARLGESSSPS